MSDNKDKKITQENTGFDKRVEDFADEVGQLGKNVGKRVEQHAKNFTTEMENLGKHAENTGKGFERWYDRTFGFFGPLFWSILGLVILGLIIVAMRKMSDVSPVFGAVSIFLTQYLPLFFALMIFFAYTSYVTRKYPRQIRWITPMFTALGFVLVLWIVVEVFLILNDYVGIPYLPTVASWIRASFILVFLLVLIFGYLILLLIFFTKQIVRPSQEQVPTRTNESVSQAAVQSSESVGYKRLYRSGKERILGGVCGGLADYFQVNPVIVRLLWVVGIFLSAGILILGYFVFWIVIPRNPVHHW